MAEQQAPLVAEEELISSLSTSAPTCTLSSLLYTMGVSAPYNPLLAPDYSQAMAEPTNTPLPAYAADWSSLARNAVVQVTPKTPFQLTYMTILLVAVSYGLLGLLCLAIPIYRRLIAVALTVIQPDIVIVKVQEPAPTKTTEPCAHCANCLKAIIAMAAMEGKWANDRELVVSEG